MSDAGTFLLVSGDALRLSSGWVDVVSTLVSGGVRVEVAVDDRLDAADLIDAGAFARPLPLGRGRAGLATSAVLLATRAAEHPPALVHVLDPALSPLVLGALAATPGAQALFSVASDLAFAGPVGAASLRAWSARNPDRAAVLLLDHAARSRASGLGIPEARWYELPAELGVDAAGLALEDDPTQLRAAARRRLGVGADDVLVAMVVSSDDTASRAAVIDAITTLRAARPAWTPLVLVRFGALQARLAIERAGARVLSIEQERALLWHAADVLWLPNVGEHEALLEASVARTPAVAVRSGAYVDIVRDGETGWLRDGLAAQCAQLVQVASRGLERSSAGAAARSRAMRGWDRGLCVERLLRAYDAVLTGEAPQARLDLAAGRIVGESGLERRRRELVRPGRRE